MNKSRTKRKSSGISGLSDFNLNDFHNDSKQGNTNPDSDDHNYSEKQIAEVRKTYQDLVTSIMYSMFNPCVSYPEQRIDLDDDQLHDDDPNIPVTEDYDSPVTTLKLKVASKKDNAIRNELLDYLNASEQRNSEKLRNSNGVESIGIPFVSTDLSLPQVSISRNMQRKELKARDITDKKLQDKQDWRTSQVKKQREMIQAQKEMELYKERKKRREKVAEKEASMTNKQKRKLEEARKDLQDRKSQTRSMASRSMRPDDNQTTNSREYLEHQKRQKEEFLKTRGKTKKEDNVISILMGNY
ncbi:hypothetical protein M9Y10_044938 [Tritrichomonas musculus]|uniref:Uncharacterized protein n=1 Tax=Tritrichomonas musculus TaxID=1915356 RepID=A0ABR2JTU0_9EUKA